MLALSLALGTPTLAAEPEVPAVTVTRRDAPADAPETVSLRVSVLPGIGIGASPEAAIDGLSVGLVSRAAALDGVDAQLGLSWVDGPVDGVQGSAFASWARGDLALAQLSGAVGLVGGDLSGVQGAGGLNVVLGRMDGLQGAGGMNAALGGGSGLQGAGGMNLAGGAFDGVQAAPLNVARDLEGLQVGLVNVGRDVRGVQLGLVNVARTSQVSIAPINLIGDGLHRLDVWTSESAVGTAALKFGSKHVYTLIGAGWVNPGQAWWTWGGGLGVHLPVRPVWLEVDGTAWGVARGNVLAPGVHGKLRAQVGVDLAKHLAPFAGVSVNTWTGDGSVAPRAIGLPSSREGQGRFVAWPGLHAGVSF